MRRRASASSTSLSQPGFAALAGVGDPKVPSPRGWLPRPNGPPTPASGSRGVPLSSRSFGSGSGVRTGMCPVYRAHLSVDTTLATDVVTANPCGIILNQSAHDLVTQLE